MPSWRVFLGLGLLGLGISVRADTVLSTASFSCQSKTAAYTVPAGTDYIIVKCWGAGGACGASTPGGDGACVEASYNVSPGQTCSISVGAGGSGTCAGGWPDGGSGKNSCGGGGGSTTVVTPGGTAQAAGGSGGDNNGGWGFPGGCNYNPPGGQHWCSNSLSGCGGGSANAAGSCFNSLIQCGANGHPPCANDPNYPGNNCGSGGVWGQRSDGCQGGCVIIACQRTPPPVITSSLTAAGRLNVPLGYTITASGSPTGFGASGIPPGLTVNAATGAISGTPTAAGTYSVTLSATNAGGTGTATLAFTIAPTFNLAITASPAVGGTFAGAGIYNPGTVVPIAEVANLNYRTSGWGGPDGRATASPGNATTSIVMTSNRTLVAEFVPLGTLAVTAAAGGTASGGGVFVIGSSAPITATALSGYIFTGWAGTGITNPLAASTTVTVPGNETVTANFTPAMPPVFTSGNAPQTIYLGRTFSLQSSATNAPTFNATSLPSGLAISSSTGLISGTPTTTGAWNCRVTATNARGSASQTISFTVLPTTPSYTLAISGSPAAGGSFTGAGIYAAGSTVQVSESAGAGFRANGWGGPDSAAAAAPGSAATSIVMSSNRTLVAQFTPQGTLTVTAGAGGTAAGSGVFDLGSSPAITATPAVGSVFSGWTGTGIANPNASSTTVSLAGSESVTANFALAINSPLTDAAKLNEPYSYTIASAGGPTSFNAANLPPGLSVNTATGVISGAPTATGSFTITLSAANAGESGTATLTLTVAKTYTLAITASPSGGGTFAGAGVYDPGTVVQIAESPNTNYRTSGWGGPDGAATAAPASATTSITLNADATLTAQFVAQGTLSVSAGPGGAVTGGGVYDIGANAPVATTATGGSVFTGWSGSGLADANAASTTVAITGNIAVAANFTSAVPEQLGTIVFPNADASGISGVTPTTSTMPAVLVNNGSSSETITNLTTTGDFQPTVSLPLTIAPGASASVTVTFAPSALGEETGVLTAVSNSSANPVAQFTLQGDGVNPSQPPTATISAPATAYTGSPLTLSSTAFAPNNNLTLHSIEWMSPSGAWTFSTASVSGGNSSRTLGVNFSTTGIWTLRAGASIDNGATWVYSPSTSVTVSSGVTSYTLETMAVPFSNMQPWYTPSPVIQQTYQVQHINP